MTLPIDPYVKYPYGGITVSDPYRAISITSIPNTIYDTDSEIESLRRIVENLLGTVTSLRLDVAVLKKIITSEERTSLLGLLESEDPAAVELAKTMMNELNI